ncbi:hypothetical protein ABKN59_002069, partial [Abortiporus biennis]
ATVCRTDAGTS